MLHPALPQMSVGDVIKTGLAWLWLASSVSLSLFFVRFSALAYRPSFDEWLFVLGSPAALPLLVPTLILPASMRPWGSMLLFIAWIWFFWRMRPRAPILLALVGVPVFLISAILIARTGVARNVVFSLSRERLEDYISTHPPRSSQYVPRQIGFYYIDGYRLDYRGGTYFRADYPKVFITLPHYYPNQGFALAPNEFGSPWGDEGQGWTYQTRRIMGDWHFWSVEYRPRSEQAIWTR